MAKKNGFGEFIDAVQKGDVKIVEKICQHDWIEEELDGRRPIHWACANGHADIVQLLLDKGAQLEVADRIGRRPLHLACDKGNVDVTLMLLHRSCQLESADGTGRRPLHCACDKGHADVVKLLLDKGCHLDAADLKGWRPIHLACDNGHAEVTQMLLERGCQFDAEDRIGRRPLHWACDRGYAAVVRMLLDRGCHLEAADLIGRRPIHLACDKGHADVVQVLLERICRMDTADEKGLRPIHLACGNGYAAVVQLLLDKGSLLETEDWIGRRPIHLACEKGHFDVVQILIDRFCLLEEADGKGWRPIHWACDKGHVDVVRLLVGRGCEVNARTKQGQRPLDLAKKCGNMECARIIEEAQKIEKIFHAARNDDLKLLQSLQIVLWTKEAKTGQTLLDVIMQTNAKSIIESIKRTPVTDKDISDFLSLDRKDFTAQSYGLLRQWLVHCCIRHNIDWAFLRLCSADVVNASPLPDWLTCLETAVEYRRSLCVRHILHKYVAPDDSWDRAWIAAMQKGHEEVIEFMQHRHTVLQRNASMGHNRLHLAVTEGDLDMVEYVMRKGLMDHSQTNHNGNSPLMMAVSSRMDECAAEIQKHGADVNTVNKHGQTVLHAAVTGRMDSLPQWMIDGTRQVEQRDCMGLTALQQAVLADLENVVAQLLTVGATHRSVLETDSTSFCQWKCRLALTAKENVASLCLKLHGCLYPSILNAFNLNDVDFTDANGDSLLHMTALLANADECAKLLDKGANVSSKNKSERTPLLELLFRVEHNEMIVGDDVIAAVGCLVERGSHIDEEDETGRTALQMAVGLVGPDAERLMLQMVKKGPFISKFSQDQFNSCVERKLCQFLEALVPLFKSALAEEFITTDAVRQSMTDLQPSTTRTLFSCASADVKKDLVDEMLRGAARENDEEYFQCLLKDHNVDWTVMPDGETILTALMKEANLKFCRSLLNARHAAKLVQLTNQNGDSPLMVALKEGLDDLMDELILQTEAPDGENADGSSALSLLFQQVSETERERQAKLSLWIRQLISMSANIYKANRNEQTAISFCTNGQLKAEFELLYNKRHRREIGETADVSAAAQDQTPVCSVCLDRLINCSLRCGHTFCMDCVERFSKCPFCSATNMTAKRLFFN